MGRIRHSGAIAAIVLALGSAPAVSAPQAKVGRPAPPTTITLFDHSKVKLADLRGKVVVINHWATWCGPCKAEMPMMSAFHARYKNAGFEIYGVTSEDSLPAYMLKKVADLLSYPLSRGLSGNSYPTLDGVPTSYVIDRSGIVRYAKAGSFTPREFAELLLPLLREPAPGK
jgi:cytochrome c biogenesis protein CcmG/thiol:disulfide interchange protein DsbE